MRIARAVLWQAVASVAVVVDGCRFDCGSSPPRLCGGAVHFVNHTFNVEYLSSDGQITVTSEVLHTLDLSGRGITAIAPDGLHCYTTAVGDDDYTYDSTVTQAILLDNNSLLSVPSMNVFDGVGVISLQNNGITALQNRTFARCNCYNLNVYLQNNGITALQDGTFSGFGGGQLFVFLQNNSITALRNGTFAAFGGSYLFVDLQNNSITALQYRTFAGFGTFGGIGGAQLRVFLQNNGITALQSGTFAGFGGEMLTVDLQNNSIAVLQNGTFAGFAGFGSTSAFLQVDLQNNRIAELQHGMFAAFGSGFLTVDLQNNSITALESGTFAGFGGSDLTVDLQDNSITALQHRTFAGFDGIQLVVDLQNNGITVLQNETFAGVCMGFPCVDQMMLTVDLQNNSITVLQSGTFAEFGGLELNVDLRNNSITTLQTGTFSECMCTQLNVDLQNNGVMALQNRTFVDVSAGTTLTVDLQNNGITALQNGTFAGFSGVRLNVNLQGNGITALQNGTFGGVDTAGAVTVDLQNNGITALQKGTFARFGGGELTVDLQNNGITALQNGTFANFGSGFLTVNLQNNDITALQSGTFSDVGSAQLYAYLQNNSVMELQSGTFAGFGGSILFLYLQNNSITVVQNGTFAGFGGGSLFVFLENNSLTALQNGTFAGFRGVQLTVFLQYNSITALGAIFRGFEGTVACFVHLSDNHIDGLSVKSALNSFTESAAALTLNVSGNDVTSVPEGLFSPDSDSATGLHSRVTVDLSFNPILHVSSSLFDVGYSQREFQSIVIDMSHPTRGHIHMPPLLPYYDGIVWDSTGGTLNVSLAGAGVDFDVVRALSGSYGPKTLAVDLSHNNYTSVPAGAFDGSLAAWIDLSHNEITNVSASAFNYTLLLDVLDLSHNNLTVIEEDLMFNMPGLSSLVLTGNEVLAIPQSSNHIAEAADVSHNPLQCATYGPVATNCTCTSGLHVSIHCGYVRCTPHPDGCAPGTILNKSDCTNAPWSACVSDVPADQYYDNATQSFLPAMICATAFPRRRAYEVSNRTVWSNRECSICSTCPAGFDMTLCTATTNTQCTKQFALSSAAIGGIIVGVLIPLVGLVLTVLYVRHKATRTELGETKNYLELTEQLLGDEREEKEQMEQAWSIAESDLTIGDVIGEGAYGRVFRGTWGHIAVAIKVLRHPLDELDPTMTDDFRREVKFMRSIRHPHVLTFYGAGVDTQSRAFLVTELMKGSLKTLLRDRAVRLDWSARLTFALDAARGMKYLHDKGAVHRDLKADNCFVDDAMRVKVADFGTGRLTAQMQDRQSENEQPRKGGGATVLSRAGSAVAGRTLSKGVGSLLWMAPEALRGSRVREGQATALDVYSFAIVLWEIWTRARPWDEIHEEGIRFGAKLTEVVNAGQRPALPDGCEEAPGVYRELMAQCWAMSPDDRPTFAAVVEVLSEILRVAGTESNL
eukprot:CAMPEP_0206306090 /NCGR_PEP_ID=MMETSP0106_2-20121207/10618_1 /ASSEMBLY_ACC=CAM_ASM_000206 /TAXON_ID=81532 /ORGANISM="Acanthoeca-like sp., Strain 10tr" /LENGTH=1445 /DNA_ID=CAMNT_0053736995 /DNA_START=267 /DNA_END=4604 /DNA_ORIENTATION=-